LRLLGNLEARQGKALQVVLVGLPSLLDALARPDLAALRQRLVVRTQLDPLDVHESADYLLSHLRRARLDPHRVVDEEALALLARNAQGVPRLLNQAGHAALRLAHEAGGGAIDVEVAMEALAGLGLSDEAPPEEEALGAGGVVLVDGDEGDGVLPLPR